MSYQLQNLSPPEFTELIGDLLSSELAVRLSKSPEGPDGGIDLLRAGRRRPPEIVVQCKHYWKTSISALKRVLRKEVVKVARIKPKRYIVATSIELTTAQKTAIAAMFPTFLHSIDDVIGEQDIGALLRKHPAVERSHYKLWIGSSALLAKIVHHGTSVWYQELLARLEEHKQVYVQTPSFSKALEILNKHRIVLIAGGPGVGKTTLANILSATLVGQGFEFREIIDLEHDIKDLPEEGNVVLYYDDFLGHSVWRDTTAGSEKRLDNLIRLAERNHRFWLILTTRTYLLEDARKVSTAVEQRLNKDHEVVLHVDGMSLSTRARILYNHLYFNKVSPGACKSLTDWKRLSSILSHANFNPRIIEYVTKSAPADLPHPEYVDFIEGHLERPTRLYESAIRDRIGAEARDILFVLQVLGDGAEYNHVYRVWSQLRRDLDFASENKEVFRRKTKALDGNLIRLTRLWGPEGQPPRDGLRFYNPGVGEMVRDLLWFFDDRWMWSCKTAETCGELLNLARCVPGVKPKVPSVPFAVTLPHTWYGRWNELLRDGVADAGDSARALGQSLALRAWDGHTADLLNSLELWHDNDASASVPWSSLGAEPISREVQEALFQVSWLPEQLEEEVAEYVMSQRGDWDPEEAGDLYAALDHLGPASTNAILRLKEAGLQQVMSFLTLHESDNEIYEDSYYDATSLNENLQLGLDNEFAELEARVRRTQSPRTALASPKVWDDPLSEAEVQAMFTSLALGDVVAPNSSVEVPS